MTIQEAVLGAMGEKPVTRNVLAMRLRAKGTPHSLVQIGNALRLMKGRGKVRIAPGVSLGLLTRWERVPPETNPTRKP